jgi:hypothetical protein
MSSRVSQKITYRVKIPLRGFGNKPSTDTLIPAGSTIEWQRGKYAGAVASVLWLGQRVLVKEGDLFKNCEQLAVGLHADLRKDFVNGTRPVAK